MDRPRETDHEKTLRFREPAGRVRVVKNAPLVPASLFPLHANAADDFETAPFPFAASADLEGTQIRWQRGHDPDEFRVAPAQHDHRAAMFADSENSD